MGSESNLPNMMLDSQRKTGFMPVCLSIHPSVLLFINYIIIIVLAVKCKTRKIYKIPGVSSFFEVEEKKRKKLLTLYSKKIVITDFQKKVTEEM